MNFLSEEASVHVQGDIYSYKSTKQSTNAILIDIVFSFCFPIPRLHTLNEKIELLSLINNNDLGDFKNTQWLDVLKDFVVMLCWWPF